MPTATPKKKTVKKSSASKTATPKKKAAAKKTTTKKKAAAKKVATNSSGSKLGKPLMAILEVLKKGKSLTRSEISAATGIKSGFTSYLGQTDPEKREEGSLLARKLIKIEKHDRDGKDVLVYSITATGKKAISS